MDADAGCESEVGEVCEAGTDVVATDAWGLVDEGAAEVADGDASLDAADAVEGELEEAGVGLGVTPVPIGKFCRFCSAMSMSLIAWVL